MAVSHAKSNIVADFTGTATVFNSQGSTTTVAATDLVRPSDWNSAHNETYYLDGNTAGASSVSGTGVYFHGEGMVTLSGTSNSIMFSVGYSKNEWENLNRQSMNLISNVTAISGKPLFFPCEVNVPVAYNYWNIALSRGVAGSNAFTIYGGLYTGSNSTRIDRLASFQNVYSHTDTGSVSGGIIARITGMEAAGTNLTPGNYVACLVFSCTATASMNYSLRGEATANPPVGLIAPGTNNRTTANLSTIPLERFQGLYSATSASPPSTVGTVDIAQWTNMVKPYLYMGTS
jgi:hypothetical protein